MQVLVSIIIPTFNSELFLEETLESVLSQTHSYWECIIVDDGSTDATKTIATQYQEKDNRFRNYNRPENLPKGPSSARNFGLEKANGDYVVFLDSDDLLSANCLENRIAQFTQNLDCDFLVFQMQRFLNQPDYSKITIETEKDKKKVLESFIHLHGQWPITSTIYKRVFFETIQFNPQLVVFEDLELAIRAIVTATNFKIFNSIDCYYRNDVNYKTKYNTVSVKTKMVKAFQALILSLEKLMKLNTETQFQNKEIKYYMLLSYKVFFRYTILENSKAFQKDNKKIIQLLQLNGVLNKTQQLKFRLVAQILLPFAHIKGSGIARVIKKIYN